ncbi:MAG: SDR family NAD(P)-dependent oxidoreductase [Candidatus Poseidoniales archaeon]|jgi:pteridine reductase
MATPLAGRSILVTGGGRRIGAAICREFAKHGANVIIHRRTSAEEAEKLAKEINGHVVAGDITSEEDRIAIVADTRAIIAKAGHEGLFCLVHSASVFGKAALEDITNEEADWMFEVNSKSPLLLTKSLAKDIKDAKGSIISLTDTSWEKPWANFSMYCATKAALRTWTLALAQELAPDVRANCVAPGAILPAPHEEHLVDSIAEGIPMARWGKPLDIAEAVVFLATAPYITGQVLAVDGGWSTA